MRKLSILILFLISISCGDLEHTCNFPEQADVLFSIVNNDTTILESEFIFISTEIVDSSNLLTDLTIVWENSSGIGTLQNIEGSANVFTAPNEIIQDTFTIIRAFLKEDPNTFDELKVNIVKRDDPEDSLICFERDILPIFRNSCAISGCHDAQSAEDDLVFSDYDGIMEKIRPGEPSRSKIYQVITEDEASDIMPPPPYDALSNDDIDLIRQWILEGAENTKCDEIDTECDSTNVSYQLNVRPIINTYCIGCHNQVPSGNVSLNNYQKVRQFAENGQLMGSILHEPAYVPMPYQQAKISDCDIAIIRNWILEGYTE